MKIYKSLALVSLLGALLPITYALAQATVPGASGGTFAVDKESPKAVKIVCLGYDRNSLARGIKHPLADALDMVDLGKALSNQKDRADIEKELRQLFPPVGQFVYKEIGSGFVIGANREFVVTNYHVAEACPSNAKYSTQLGIIQPAGSSEINAILADIQDRPSQDPEERQNGKREQFIPKVICSTSAECKISQGWDSALEIRRPILPEKSIHILPDVAIIKLRSPTVVPPLEMDAATPLKSGEDLDIFGFPGEPTEALQQNDSNRWTSAFPLLTSARFIQKTSYGNRDKGGLTPAELFSQEMYLISAQVKPGNSGGPLVNKAGKVVGIVTHAVGKESDVSYGQATPVSTVIDVLNWLGIREQVLGKGTGGATPPPALLPPPPPPAAKNFLDQLKDWLKNPTHQLIVAAAVLVLVALGVIGAATKKPGKPYDNSEDKARLEKERLERDLLDKERVEKDRLDKERLEKELLNSKYALVLSQAGNTNGEIRFPTPSKITTIVVGRDAKTCQFVFGSDAVDVGRLHAHFTWSESNNKLYVQDQNSTNGTFVNGTKIQSHVMVELKSGDKVDIGRAEVNRFTVRQFG